MQAKVNEVTLIDNPWQNPYSEEISHKQTYLTVSGKRVATTHEESIKFLSTLDN